MPSSSVTCPYCNAENSLTTIKVTRKAKFWLFKLFEWEDSSSAEFISHDLKCILCHKKYIFINLSEYSWLKRRLALSDTSLQSFKSIFPEAGLDSIIENIVGVTRPKVTMTELFRRNRIHICFDIEGKRAYVDCHHKKGKLTGLNIYEV